MIEALFLAEIFIFVFILIIVFKNGGIRQHLALLFVSFVLFIFIFYSPLYGYINNIEILFNNDVSNYYPEILFNYLIALISFLLGYLLFKKQRTKKVLLDNNKNYVSVAFLRLWFIIAVGGFAIWGITSGKSLSNIFLLGFFGLSDIDLYMSANKGNNYVKLLLEMLTPLLILAYFSKMTKKEFIFWMLITIIIYLSQGFRFRFIILISAFLLVYLHKNEHLSIKKILYTFLLLMVFMYGVMQVSQYRSSIKSTVKGSYIENQDNNKKGLGRMIYRSTRNYLAFGSLIKYMETNNITYGYGDTMFKQIFIRLVPSSMFDHNIKPIPRGNMISAKSWGSREALRAGEAYGAVGGAYYELGTIGVSLFFLLLGTITKYLDTLTSLSRNKIKLSLYIVTIASLFKVITRGYLPEFFFMYLYFMLPFLYIKYFYPNLWSGYNIRARDV